MEEGLQAGVLACQITKDDMERQDIEMFIVKGRKVILLLPLTARKLASLSREGFDYVSGQMYRDTAVIKDVWKMQWVTKDVRDLLEHNIDAQMFNEQKRTKEYKKKLDSLSDELFSIFKQGPTSFPKEATREQVASHKWEKKEERELFEKHLEIIQMMSRYPRNFKYVEKIPPERIASILRGLEPWFENTHAVAFLCGMVPTDRKDISVHSFSKALVSEKKTFLVEHLENIIQKDETDIFFLYLKHWTFINLDVLIAMTGTPRIAHRQGSVLWHYEVAVTFGLGLDEEDVRCIKSYILLCKK